MRLTKRFLDQIPTPSQMVVYRDLEAPGLGYLVRPPSARRPAGRRSWVFEYRRPGAGRRGAQVRIKLGDNPPMTLIMARDLARNLYQRTRAGEDPRAAIKAKADTPTLKVFGQLFLDHYGQSLKAKTQADYRYLLERHIFPKIGHVRIVDLRSDHIVDVKQQLGNTRTCGKALALLHRMMELAERPLHPWNGVRSPHSNPVHGIEIIKGRRSERRFSEKELRALWSATAELEQSREISAWAASIIRCFMFSGARFRELAGDRNFSDMGARWERFDPERGRLRLDDHKSSRLRGPKVLHLDRRVVEEMQRLPKVGAYIFANSRQPELPIGSGAQHAFAKVRHAANIGDGSLHTLRHTVLNLADEAGLPREHAGAAVGHTTIKTTEMYLEDSRASQARQAVKVFADQISRIVG